MKTDLELFGKPCGRDHSPLIVAELSGNHGGRLERALQMLDAAVDCGVDAIKIQTYRPDTITIDHDGPDFLIESGLWAGRNLFDLYSEAHTPWEWHRALFERAAERGVPLFSSPFDPSAVDLLESLACPAYKIASFELTDIGLIRRVAATGKPVILSTGMATLQEIDEAVAVFGDYEPGQCVILHCTSSYPAPLEEADLNTIPMLAERYGVPVGLSDHTPGIVVPVAAVALGACLVEKHFTLDRGDGAVDAAFSLEPAEFRALGDACRQAWQALGAVRTGPSPAEVNQRRHRRSLYAVADIGPGEPFTAANVRSIRPGHGLHPRYLEQLMGCVAGRAIRRGEPVSWDMVGEGAEQAQGPGHA
jgi:N-acetylneuraminate synthase